MTDNKIVAAIFIFALTAMLYTSGLTLEPFKHVWRWFLNLKNPTQILLIYLAVWAPITLFTVFYWGW